MAARPTRPARQAPVTRQAIFSDRVLRPTAPYSSAVRAGGFVFVSGMVPFTLDGRIARDDFPAQMRQTLDNVRAVLEAAGSSLAKVVKVTVILARGADFAEMNAIYRAAFPEPFPARTTFEGRLPHPDFLVELDCIAEA